MQNKSKNWNDVEMLISAIAIALTLGLWNLLASPKKPGVDGAQSTARLPRQPNTASLSTITTAPTPMLLPGQVLLFGSVGPQSISQPQPQTPPTVVQSGGGKGGGTVTKTHSSHP